MICNVCNKKKRLSNWSAITTIGTQDEQFHENVCVECSEILPLIASTIPDVTIVLQKKCECCGKPITGESLYHPGTHLYVCSFECHQHLTEEMITTFGTKRGPSDAKTDR